MKKIFTITAALLFATSLFASDKLDRERVVKGKVVTAKGDTLDGWIREMKMPSLQNLKDAQTSTVAVPDAEFGDKVKFISNEDWDKKKHVHENDYTKCKPDKFKGYVYDYTGIKKVFTTLPVKVNKKPKPHFVQMVEPLSDNEYYVYFYKSFGTQVGGAGTIFDPTDEELLEYTTPHEAIYFKDQNVVLLVKDIDPVEFYQSRCQEVYDKWNLGTYMDVNKGQSKFSKGLDKAEQILSFGKKVVDPAVVAARLNAFQDYRNACVKK